MLTTYDSRTQYPNGMTAQEGMNFLRSCYNGWAGVTTNGSDVGSLQLSSSVEITTDGSVITVSHSDGYSETLTSLFAPSAASRAPYMIVYSNGTDILVTCWTGDSSSSLQDTFAVGGAVCPDGTQIKGLVVRHDGGQLKSFTEHMDSATAFDSSISTQSSYFTQIVPIFPPNCRDYFLRIGIAVVTVGGALYIPTVGRGHINDDHYCVWHDIALPYV